MNDKLILNISAVINGGAGNYALQNHRLLLKLGYNSYLIIKTNTGKVIDHVITYPDLKWKRVIPKIQRMICKKILKAFRFDEKYLFYNKIERINCYSASTILKLLPRKPDVIFIYWVSGFVNAKLLSDLSKLTKAKIYVLLIDNAPLTGGCHYPWDCKGYQEECLSCPAIYNKFLKKLANRNLQFKKKNNPKDITLIAATQSDFYRTKSSSLFKDTECIKITEVVDNELFKPSDNKKDLKKYFGIDENKKVLLIGATFLNERRKGMAELIQALQFVNNNEIFILVAGTTDLGTIEIDHKYIGYLSEDELIKAYQAAHLFVCPSLEDSGPLMINQAIMCGTPVVAFNMGSATDLVRTGETGYLARHKDTADLAKGINYIISLNELEYAKMSENCRSLAMKLFSTPVFNEQIEKLLNF